MVQTGQKFGMLTLLAAAGGTGRHPKWRMLCDCGVEKIIDLGAVKSGRQVACGCFRKQRSAEANRLNLTGERVGMLFVRNFYTSVNAETLWMCQCDCGCGYIARGTHLSRGRVQSCGCLRRPYTDRQKTEKDLAKYAANHSRRAAQRGAKGRFTAKQINRLYELQRGRCANCGTSLAHGYHRDHKTPLSRGGSNELSNIELLCGKCNTRKHAKDPVAWAAENGRLL